MSSRLTGLLLCALCLSCGAAASPQTGGGDFLASNTVLIVRHAEKPRLGRELTPRGEARAQAYAHYFEPFHEDGLDFHVDALYGGKDSDNSIRPRLTLEPLSRVTGLRLDTSVSTDNPDALVALLRHQAHGPHPLIAWRHGHMPALLKAFGASPDLIPGGKWPDDTYDWVIVLRFDSAGHLETQKLLQEHLELP